MATVAACRVVFVNVTPATWAVRVSFKVETPSALATARQAVAPTATARASALLLGEQGVKVIAVDVEFAVEHRLGYTLLNEHEKLFGNYWRQTFGPGRSPSPP